MIRPTASIVLAGLFGLVGCAAPARPGAPRPNVLLICVDDLRPELGCMGAGHMRTPNLDQLAREGVVFERHYVQVPTCGASRASMLTGRYPRRLRAIGNGAFAALPRTGHAHLPGWFRAHGYTTVSIGKITHTPDGSRRQQRGGDGEPELANAWDEYGAPSGRWGDAWSAFFGYADGSHRRPGETAALERGSLPASQTPDGLIATAAIEKLRQLRDGSPFLLAVGFYKPHLPHNAPAASFDRYPLASVRLPRHRIAARGIDPKISLHSSGELLANYGRHPEGGLSDDRYVRRLRRAYYACVSHVDDQIGRVLRALRENGLDQNTIVVVWGDHGFHLGDHGIWGKHTLHERALHSVLLVRTPSAGSRRCRACVESVDLFPTLVELCDLPPAPDLDGRSLVPELCGSRDDAGAVARSYWRRGRNVGRTIRTQRWRLTEWRRGRSIVQVELYDHDRDPEETRNVASAHAALVTTLTRRLGPPAF